MEKLKTASKFFKLECTLFRCLYLGQFQTNGILQGILGLFLIVCLMFLTHNLSMNTFLF